MNYIRFYEELNYFINKKYHKKDIEFEYQEKTSVKKIIEDFGVPHSEVDMILVNGKSTGFDHKIEDNDRISVYPVFESFDIAEVSKVRQKPLRILKFILDVHLGRLAKYLRIIGFDTLYFNNYADEKIVEISKIEKRIILTRDIELLKRKNVTHAYYIRSLNIYEQLKEVIRRFQLEKKIKAFSICPECNSKLKKISKNNVKGIVPPYIYKIHSDFKYCYVCSKAYWKGTHLDNIKQKLSGILNIDY